MGLKCYITKKSCTDGENPTKKLNIWVTSHFKVSFWRKKKWNSNVRCADPILIGLKEFRHKQFQVNRTSISGRRCFWWFKGEKAKWSAFKNIFITYSKFQQFNKNCRKIRQKCAFLGAINWNPVLSYFWGIEGSLSPLNRQKHLLQLILVRLTWIFLCLNSFSPMRMGSAQRTFEFQFFFFKKPP